MGRSGEAVADDHGEGAGTHPEAVDPDPEAVDPGPDPIGVRDSDADRDDGAEHDGDSDAGTEYAAVRDAQRGDVLDPVRVAVVLAFDLAGAGRGVIAAGPVLPFAR